MVSPFLKYAVMVQKYPRRTRVLTGSCTRPGTNENQPASLTNWRASSSRSCRNLMWAPVPLPHLASTRSGAGMPWLPSGAKIGIPANFNSMLDDPAGITNSTILINGKEVEWNSDIGTALKDALVFSPEAQKFAMAREVAHLEVGGLVLNAAVAPFCLAGVMV